MGNKVFTKQLTLLVLGAAIVFLSACSEIVELPDTVASDTAQTTEQQPTEQETSLAAPTTVEQSAAAPEPQEPTETEATTTEPTETETTSSEPTETETTSSEPVTTPLPEPVITEPQTSPTEPVVVEPVTTTSTPEEPVEPIETPTTEPTQQTTIWQPKPGTSWQWQLSGTLDISLDVEMYDIDLFDTKQSIIDQLHAENRIVICYFSAGSLEPWRSDVSTLPKEVIGKKMSGWDEYWLDISKIDKLEAVMLARLDLAVEKNCDGVEPDNIDAYQNDSGFPLTGQDQLNYNIFLAEEAHKRGLSIGLKNDLGQVAELEPYFDWALNESCYQYNECHLLSPFIKNNKAVFGVEYIASTSEFCGLVNDLNFDFLKKDHNLSAYVVPCR